LKRLKKERKEKLKLRKDGVNGNGGGCISACDIAEASETNYPPGPFFSQQAPPITNPTFSNFPFSNPNITSISLFISYNNNNN
jgi:hypothetical protein